MTLETLMDELMAKLDKSTQGEWYAKSGQFATYITSRESYPREIWINVAGTDRESVGAFIIAAHAAIPDLARMAKELQDKNTELNRRCQKAESLKSVAKEAFSERYYADRSKSLESELVKKANHAAARQGEKNVKLKAELTTVQAERDALRAELAAIESIVRVCKPQGELKQSIVEIIAGRAGFKPDHDEFHANKAALRQEMPI